jgi:hypothetical protein
MELTQTDLILIGVIVGLIFMLYVMPTVSEGMAEVAKEKSSVVKVDMNTCSRSCCKHTQWPVPHMKNEDKEHVGSNLMCNAGNGGGCVCVNDADKTYLTSRGQNGLDAL